MAIMHPTDPPWTEAISTRGVTAVSLLSNLEAAQRGRSLLFSDEQKLPFKGVKKGVLKRGLLRTPN